MTPEKLADLARSFLPEHAIERVKTTADLIRELEDWHVRRLRPFPHPPLEPATVESVLRARFADRIEGVPSSSSRYRFRLRRVLGTTAPTDIQQIAESLFELGTHARLKTAEPDDEPLVDSLSERDPTLALTFEAVLTNENFGGKTPAGDGPPFESGTLGSSLVTHDITCPFCRAVHVIVQTMPSHSQDREDVPFLCMRCRRHELIAHGIPELVGFRIDLLDRLPPLEKLKRKVAGMRPTWWAADPVIFIPCGVLAVTIVLLILAWSSDSFDDSAFSAMRGIATASAAGSALLLGVWARWRSDAAARIAFVMLAATLTSMIPVVVALVN